MFLLACGIWGFLLQVSIYQVLCLLKAPISSDVRVVVCLETSVFWRVQQKLSVFSSSEFSHCKDRTLTSEFLTRPAKTGSTAKSCWSFRLSCEVHRRKEAASGKPLIASQNNPVLLSDLKGSRMARVILCHKQGLWVFLQEGWEHLQDTQTKRWRLGGQSRPIFQDWVLSGCQTLCYVLYMDGASIIRQIQVHMLC